MNINAQNHNANTIIFNENGHQTAVYKKCDFVCSTCVSFVL